jgi:hypothetical protein
MLTSVAYMGSLLFGVFSYLVLSGPLYIMNRVLTHCPAFDRIRHWRDG